MSNITKIMNNSFKSSALTRLIPEPKSSISLKGLVNTVSNAITNDSSTSMLNGEYASLIEKQMEMQEQMMLVSMISNSEKTEHETRMAAVRNIRVS